MCLTSDHRLRFLNAAFAAMMVLSSVATAPALAATEVHGQKDDLQIDAKNASIREILDALAAKYSLTYKLPPNINRVITGRYTGALSQILRRVLDGNDFIIKASEDGVEVVVFGMSQPTAIVAAEPPNPSKGPALAASGLPSKPPPLNSYLSGNAATASAGGSP
jgi:uncharacterized protein (DUF2342 family)